MNCPRCEILLVPIITKNVRRTYSTIELLILTVRSSSFSAPGTVETGEKSVISAPRTLGIGEDSVISAHAALETGSSQITGTDESLTGGSRGLVPVLLTFATLLLSWDWFACNIKSEQSRSCVVPRINTAVPGMRCHSQQRGGDQETRCKGATTIATLPLYLGTDAHVLTSRSFVVIQQFQVQQ